MLTEPVSWNWCVTSSPRARSGLAPVLSLCLAAALTAVAVGLALPLLVLQAALPRLEGQLEVRGLDTVLRIVRDAHGVPHVAAGSERDAWFGLGFVHAQDRFTAMEFARRAGRGRLAEIMGAAAVPLDRKFRTIGYARSAEAVAASLDSKTQDLLQGYADGVNAALESNHRPFELRVLGLTPEPWLPADSILAIKMMGTLLSGNADTEAERARLLPRLGEARLRELSRSVEDPLAGSNAWAVAGRHSASGAPLLASDPHLRLAAPSVWYLAHLEAPGLRVWGATLPGIAAVPIGRNQQVAWGMTSVYADVQDLYVETEDPTEAGSYLTPDGSEPFRVRSETIAVRGRDPVHLTVRTTRHGPVVSDLPEFGFAGPGQVVAFRSHELANTDLSQRAAFQSVRAATAAAFREAMYELEAVVQIAVHADVDDNIGYVMTGRIPVRATGDGFLPVEGADSGAAWIGSLEGAALPSETNPPDGWVASANEYLAPAGYQPFIMRDRPSSYRAERLQELLASVPSGGFTPARFADMQTDIVSPGARAIVPLLLAAGPFPQPDADAADLLNQWDFRMEAGRPEPLVYSAWHRALTQRLLSTVFGNGTVPLAPRPQLLVDLLTGRVPGCGDLQHSCVDVIRGALRDAVHWLQEQDGDDLQALRWDSAATGVHRHRPLGELPLVGNLVNIVRSHEGGPFTLMRMHSDWSNNGQPFAGIHGAGVRMVHDLAEPTRSWAVLSTGQAGHPLSPWYRDQADQWFAGRLLPFDSDWTKIRTGQQLMLIPQRDP